MTFGPDPRPERSRSLHLSRFLAEHDEDEAAPSSVANGSDRPRPPGESGDAVVEAGDETGGPVGVGPPVEPARRPSGGADPADQSGTTATGSVDAVRLLGYAATESARILDDARSRAARLLDEACADAATAAGGILEEARREADLMVESARAEAEAIRQRAAAEATQLRTECATAILTAKEEATSETNRRRLGLEHEIRSRQAELESELARVVAEAQEQAAALVSEAERERAEILAEGRRQAERLLDLGSHAIAGAERQAAALLQAAAEDGSARQAGWSDEARRVTLGVPARSDRDADSNPEADGHPVEDGDNSSGTGWHPGTPAVQTRPIIVGTEPDGRRFEPLIGSRGRVVGRAGLGDMQRDTTAPRGSDSPEPTGRRRRRRRR